ncbi:excinuclease ABC subunit UvrA [Roseimaritima ulvae]|uniref:UvrABC system protein A n=1 Tax=Roseimaritima ulvae TaxID=980254 RepID=A0A5B9QYN7_9BACT|nr:excinuclease ABC subunit UvrA [Roseimaritima ulvae]QEG42276.1 UvrABC system protein A [Roseimaritima ulvae]
MPQSSTAHRCIQLRGVRVHNLRNIDIDLPRGQMIAVCGVSGSGKTSLALDTLYAEGQRRYIESFSAYTRQFLQRLDKPDCESIVGIPPAIAVTRSGASRGNRSTVATATEIADHLRLLYAKISRLICYQCGQPVISYDPQSAAAVLNDLPPRTRLMLGFAVDLPSRSEASETLLGLQQQGYVRLIVGDRSFHLGDSDRSELAKSIPAAGTQGFVIVDRVTSDDDPLRLSESLESAMAGGDRLAIAWAASDEPLAAAADTVTVDGRSWQRLSFSNRHRCDTCDIEYPEPVPQLFSFNNPLGACPVCEGFGDQVDVDMDLVVPDPSKTIREGAIATWNTPAYKHELTELMALADDYNVPLDVPYSKLPAAARKIIQHGVAERNFGGLDGFFAWLERKKYKMHVRVFLSRFRSYTRCSECHGKRLRPAALAYHIQGRNMADVNALQVDAAADFFDALELDERQQQIAAEMLRQVQDRLRYLQQVGLGYLQLDRTLRTLSGGETQRVALTGALGSSLVNMLYVLDEPTAGLHPHDVGRLSHAIAGLKQRGNTVVVVEHDEQLIRAADQVVEIGPQAGTAGGRLVFQGTPQEMLVPNASLTGEYLSGRRGTLASESKRRQPRGKIVLRGAAGNNLKNIDVEFPLGVLCLVTGVSGSGKSSLVHDTLYGALCRRKRKRAPATLPYDDLVGGGQIEDVMLIDQSPISRSARSIPATFVKAFDPIRAVFADTVDARTRNFTAGHFSFNNESGRCEECEGDGVLQIDMQFLADIAMTCPSCGGSRYRREVLNVRYRDRTIAEVLEMTVQSAHTFFRGHPKVQDKLKRLMDVGLGYIGLGQRATTLSSGEAQRMKLAAFLTGARRRRTLFILDEPSTGLHFSDNVQLLDCFDALLDDGHSLVVVEHNVQLMQAADYIIDLGPGAAEDGGRVVAQGTPQQVAGVKASLTGQVLQSTSGFPA